MHQTKERKLPKIAIFDYSVRPDSAMGGCHLQMLAGLRHKFDFTVFALEFDNPDPSRIKFVRIPAPMRPTILLSTAFHLLTPLYYYIYKLRHRVRFDLVERMEVYTFLGSIAYVHFCYRAYLKRFWKMSRQPGLRGLLLSLDHAVRAYLLEPLYYRAARKLIVPSQGLARELAEMYPFTKQKICVVPNSVDYDRLSNPPADFDREGLRSSFGFQPNDVVLIFIALGQFERKGLPQLLEAIQRVRNAQIKLLIVGGSSHWIHHYGRRAIELGVGGQIAFSGMQRDVAPFLWAADVFTLPSLYETFGLVVVEAAAAGCPLLVTHLHGVEDYIEDGESAIYVERNAESIARAIRTMVALGHDGRESIGRAAQLAARRFTREAFVSNWASIIEEQLHAKR